MSRTPGQYRIGLVAAEARCMHRSFPLEFCRILKCTDLLVTGMPFTKVSGVAVKRCLSQRNVYGFQDRTYFRKSICSHNQAVTHFSAIRKNHSCPNVLGHSGDFNSLKMKQHSHCNSLKANRITMGGNPSTYSILQHECSAWSDAACTQHK